MISFAGKVAIVTGSSRGIGEAIVKRLALSGAQVVVSSRKAQACEKVAESIRAAGGTAMVVPCHIGDKPQLQNLIDTTINQWGRLDALICNAAVNPHYGSSADIGDDAYDKIMNSNLRSTHWLCQMALPYLQASAGTAVLLSSVTAFRGNTNIGTYGVSKAAEIALMRNLAQEWGPQGVRINCIAPGLIKTDFARALWEDPELRARVENRIPLGRMGEPDDIASVACFLASDLSRYITGQTLIADGGMLITDPL